MKSDRLLIAFLLGATFVPSSGCLFGPHARLAECQTESRALGEHNAIQLAEIDNLKVHSKNIEDQLIRAEEELALLENRSKLDRRQLADYKNEHQALYEQLKGLASGRRPMPADVGARLVNLSQRYPSLQFDPTTGIAKLDTDVVFDTGRDELKPGAEKLIREFVDVLKTPEAEGLKIMVVGHTDSRPIARKPARDEFADNFRLSTARALAVADRMRTLGLADSRIGIAGFGAHQPIAANATTKDRQKNRRVEIFVMTPDVPVVGWTDSMPTVY